MTVQEMNGSYSGIMAEQGQWLALAAYISPGSCNVQYLKCWGGLIR